VLPASIVEVAGVTAIDSSVAAVKLAVPFVPLSVTDCDGGVNTTPALLGVIV
jgi:hypothetical protein